MSTISTALLTGLVFLVTAADAGVVIAAPSADLRERLSLAPFYAKHLDCGGMAILSSSRVSDHALREADFLVRQVLHGREDLLRAIATARIRLAVMAPSEFTLDIPEHSDL